MSSEPYRELPALLPAHAEEEIRAAEITFEPIPPPPALVRPALPAPALAGLAGRIVRTVAPHTEADPLGILACVLATFGTSVGRGPHFRVGGDRHGTNIFVSLVGPTSEGRKGTAVSEARRPFRLAGPEVDVPSASGLSSGEGFVFAIRDEIRTLRPVREKGRVIDHEEIVEDPGVSDKRLLVTESELASVLRRMEREGNTLGALMRQAWDGSDLCTLTKKAIRATAPHVSLITQITGAELSALLTETDSLNGWANRFLFVSVRRPHLLPHGGRLRDEDLLPLALELRDAVLFARDVGEMERDRQAEAAWERVYGTLTSDRPGLFGAVTARGAQQVIRISLLYALLDRAREVRAEHLASALAFWQAAEESAAHLFGGSLGDRIADDLLVELRSRGAEGMSRNEMVDLFDRNVRGARLTVALTLLARLGLASGRKERTGQRGRPTERWFSCGEALQNEINGKIPSPSADPTPSDRITPINSFTSDPPRNQKPSGGAE